MARLPNPQRPEALLDEAMRYVLHHGVSGMSLRPLARALGTSPRNLLYHFGSSDELLVAIFARIRRGQQEVAGRQEAPTLGQACWLAWRALSRPTGIKWFKLFFAAQGMALERPDKFRDFLHGSTRDWTLWVGAEMQKAGLPESHAIELATVIVAGFRGFMMDICGTGDRKRVNASVLRWTEMLDRSLAA